jgi:hypothetical protein
MTSKFNRLAKRVVVFLAAPAVAILVPLVVTPADASAATIGPPPNANPDQTYYCNVYTSGSITFEVCISDYGSGQIDSEIYALTGGSYVSGSLVLFKGVPGSSVKTSCSGKWYADEGCDFTYTTSSADYFHASWHSKSGTYYASPQIYVSP